MRIPNVLRCEMQLRTVWGFRMTIMAKDKTEKPKAKPSRSGTPLGVTFVDPEVREALDAYIDAHNAKDEHKASLKSCTEAALKEYLRTKGFWPPPKKQEAKP